VQYRAEEDDKNGNEEQDDEHTKSPRLTGSDVTHSLYRGTAYVTRICAHVSNTAAVAVSLNSHNYCL